MRAGGWALLFSLDKRFSPERSVGSGVPVTLVTVCLVGVRPK